jgi:pimeloyl-ACP methyl ester carboxylesterase
LSSPEFIQFSCAYPAQIFTDPVNEVQWQYRQGGSPDLEEAVIIIPTICESTNTMFFIASGLISEGYRVFVVSIPPYKEVAKFMNGFDRFTARMRIGEVHLIGIGFGGFLALHVTNYRHLSAHVRSLVLVSSYLSGQCFGTKTGFFSRLTGKSTLAKELEADTVPPTLRESVKFVLAEVEQMTSLVAANRLDMRANAPLARPPTGMPEGSVLIIHCLDHTMKIPAEYAPQTVMKTQTVALLKTGGLLPHLASPEKLLEYLKLHLAKWRMSMQKREDVEEEEIDDY